MFNPNRLILARKRRRLTAKALAERVGLSPITITRLEKAKNPPDAETVDLLSKELNFPQEFFFGDDTDEPAKEAVSFRSLTSMTAKERDAALSAGTIAYIISDWVSDRFNLPQTDLLDLSHERTPAHAARQLRQHWGLGEKPISNMIKLLESKGIRIFSLSENTKNVDAFSCWRDNAPYVFLNTFKSSERSRFDSAHELGHLVLHKHGGPTGRAAENEANQFASSFLMPTSDVISHIPVISSLNQIVKAKKRWGVSAAALAYNLHKAGLVSDWQYRTFCIQLNKRYKNSEPDGIERETSVVWETVFRELWNERTTRDDIAKQLQIPTEEIESLVFGLVGDVVDHGNINDKSTGRPNLQIVR